MQLILLVTLAKDQTQKYFHFFIRQPYTSQTRTESALTLLSLKGTLRNNPVTAVQVSYCLCSIEHRCFHMNTACMNQNTTIIKSQKATRELCFFLHKVLWNYTNLLWFQTRHVMTLESQSHIILFFLYRCSRFGTKVTSNNMKDQTHIFNFYINASCEINGIRYALFPKQLNVMYIQ